MPDKIDKPIILYMEDDQSLARLVQRRLHRHGYEVCCVPNGAEGLALMATTTFDLIIMDYMMPRMDGIDVLKALTERDNPPPIIMLSGRGSIPVAVEAMKLGATDYLIKDLKGEYLEQLPGLIEQVLKRRRIVTGGTDAQARIIHFSGWRLNLVTHRLLAPDGNEVALTMGEFSLLEAFLSRPNRVLSRDELLDLSRNREASLFDRSIDVQVGRLRRKLQLDAKQPVLIKTIRGAGYLFEATVERSVE